MLRLALCHTRSAAPDRRLLIQFLAYVPYHSRIAGFCSEVENLPKKSTAVNSLDPLFKTKKQFHNVDVTAKNKQTERFMSKDATNSQYQASEEIKESGWKTSRTAETANQRDEEDNMADIPGKSKSKDAQDNGETDLAVKNVLDFVKKNFSSMVAQKNKFNLVSVLPRLREEWKEAAQELIGKREKQTVDEALASVRTSSMRKPTKMEGDSSESTEYTGTSALVAVKEKENAWQRVSARFREAPIIQGILNAAKQAAKTNAGKMMQQTTKTVKDKISDAQEEVLEVWETSQNPWVYRLSSIYDGLFGETPMGVAIKEIRRADPEFILEEWKQNIEEIVLPGVLEAFLRGNSRDLKKWFGEAAYSRVNMAIRERKSEGLVMDPHVLGIDNVEVIEATAQQINCIRNREGEIVEGSEDEVLAYYYIFAFQRHYDEQQETLRWRIVDLHMQRGGKYY
ncbi:hypothetical protein PsorP6_018579 [Peronosclerospora sorghi]|nr:hypothetical protein PsorP6_018579 [Peronosclerospora sorghi]